MFRFPVVDCVLEWRRNGSNAFHRREVLDGELVCFRRHKNAWYGDHTRDICMVFNCRERTTCNGFYIKIFVGDQCAFFQSRPTASRSPTLLESWAWSESFVGKSYQIHAAMRKFQNSWRRRRRVRELKRCLSMLPDDIVEKLCGMI